MDTLPQTDAPVMPETVGARVSDTFQEDSEAKLAQLVDSAQPSAIWTVLLVVAAIIVSIMVLGCVRTCIQGSQSASKLKAAFEHEVALLNKGQGNVESKSDSKESSTTSANQKTATDSNTSLNTDDSVEDSEPGQGVRRNSSHSDLDDELDMDSQLSNAFDEHRSLLHTSIFSNLDDLESDSSSDDDNFDMPLAPSERKDEDKDSASAVESQALVPHGSPRINAVSRGDASTQMIVATSPSSATSVGTPFRPSTTGSIRRRRHTPLQSGLKISLIPFSSLGST